jgi:FkbM family methyltransferase
MHWFDDPGVTRRLPLLYRGYAWYSRCAYDRSTGRVRGGSFLLSALIVVTRIFRLTSEAAVKVGDLTVYLDLSDHHMLTVYGEMRPSHESRIMESCLSPGDTFLDIGANHGSFSMIAAKAVGASGVVAALEPQPRLASLIRRSFDANGFSQATVHEIACSDCEGVAEFYVPWRDSGSASLSQSYVAQASHQHILVRTARLDEAIDWKRFPGTVFMKVDIEGSELAFFGGAEAMLVNRQPIILFEINPTATGASGYSVEKLLDRLCWLGYERFAEIDQYPATLSRHEVNCTRQRNLVALPGRRPAEI